MTDKKVIELNDELSHKDLWIELKIIKENHLKHLHEDVDEVKAELKETRKEFNQKIDRLDNRIWWLVGLVTATMLGVIVKVVAGV